MSVDQHARNNVYVLNAIGIHYKLLNIIAHETIVELTTNPSAWEIWTILTTIADVMLFMLETHLPRIANVTVADS